MKIYGRAVLQCSLEMKDVNKYAKDPDSTFFPSCLYAWSYRWEEKQPLRPQVLPLWWPPVLQQKCIPSDSSTVRRRRREVQHRKHFGWHRKWSLWPRICWNLTYGNFVFGNIAFSHHTSKSPIIIFDQKISYRYTSSVKHYFRGRCDIFCRYKW